MMFFFAAFVAVAHASQLPCSSEGCSAEVPEQAPALLQIIREATPARVTLLEESPGANVSQFSALGVNPSGAAATLDEEGYAAVADGCCQAEMVEFIKRTAEDLSLEVCENGGLLGLAPYHSCEKGPQTFAKLVSTLLDASVERCLWVAPQGSCKEMPEDCPKFEGEVPTDCACSKAKGAKLDFSVATLAQNNLGGFGPDSGVEELRYAGAGTTAAGEPFDLVVTTLNAYQAAMKNGKNANGIRGKFGQINVKQPQNGYNGLTDFRFRFMQPGTDTPVVVPEFHMGIFDLDGTPSGYETAASKGYKGYVTDIAPTLEVSRLPDGRTKFTAQPNKAGEVPNPTDPMTLTPRQRATSVMFFYKDVSSFDLTFGFEFGRPNTGGRNLFFAGESALEDRCAA